MKKFTLLLSTLALFITGTASVNAQNITVTVAGSGIAGYSGDGGSAKLSSISGPKDVCMDAAQNIYFTDKANGRIRKINAKGVISTVAGGGVSLADGVPATTAAITPNYMCVSTGGNIYFTTANQIKKINTTTGIITTIAGTATPGFSGDGLPAISALLYNPQGICIDAANNIYFVDRGNDRIRKITATTGIITTIAGTITTGYTGDGGPATDAQLHAPVAICVNPAGDVYFSDQNPNYPNYDNSIIRKITASTGIVSHVAGSLAGAYTYGVPAIDAILGTTTGMCFGNDGNLYCDEMSCSCRMINHTTDTLELIGGNFYVQGYTDDLASPNANMNIPYGLCVDPAGSVYVADSMNQRIRKLIKLSHTPKFAYGRGEFIDAAIGIAYPVDSLLWITDLDDAQTETWSIITPPMHGTVAGFPATAPSSGTVRTTKPTGLSYTADLSYPGSDLFRVRVSDGLLSDTITIYVGEYSGTLGVNSLTTGASMNVFPNPASSVLNIQWNNMETGTTTIVISDIADRVLYNTSVVNNGKMNTKQVDISSFPAGVYIIRLNGTDVRKFVKE